MRDAIRADVLPADVSRYTNHPHIKRIQVGQDGLVREFDSWDGESYDDDYFDRRACAEAQGRASAQDGHRYTWRKANG